jgi:hypothetical protein
VRNRMNVGSGKEPSEKGIYGGPVIGGHRIIMKDKTRMEVDDRVLSSGRRRAAQPSVSSTAH